MNPQSLIRIKRDGAVLSEDNIQEFLQGVLSGEWTQGQTGSMLMAIFQQGLTLEETTNLLKGMLHSGEVLDMSGVAGIKADKHSTGGVGDKVSLILAPLAASCGLSIPMLSGRGLGHTGGTLDKLEAIPGFNVFLTSQEIQNQVRDVGCVIAGQTEAIVPADKILYAMRDETATVENKSLIAASILSKKLAEGISVLLLDVKFGRGAFLEKFEEAEQLARLMVDLGEAAGCRVTAWLTSMDTPLGRAVGNAVEVEESIAILKGEGPDELAELVCEQVAGMLLLAGMETDEANALEKVRTRLADGSALECFRQMVSAQDGDTGIIENPSRLPQSKHVVDLFHEEPKRVYVADIDSREIADIVLETGAGRKNAGEDVDHSTGLSALVMVGDCVEPGDCICRFHHSNPEKEEDWIKRIRNSITLSSEPVQAQARIVKKLYKV
ncbi:MAG: thymidine phosphorylase [Puniceicoccaceae bacterium]